MERRYVSTGNAFEEQYGYCRAVRVGDRVVVAGTAPVPPKGKPVADSPFDQMMRCGEIALSAMRELGAEARHVVRTRMYIVDAADSHAVGMAHKTLFGEHPPPSTMIVVAALLDPAWRIELELEAVVDG